MNHTHIDTNGSLINRCNKTNLDPYKTPNNMYHPNASNRNDSHLNFQKLMSMNQMTEPFKTPNNMCLIKEHKKMNQIDYHYHYNNNYFQESHHNHTHKGTNDSFIDSNNKPHADYSKKPMNFQKPMSMNQKTEPSKTPNNMHNNNTHKGSNGPFINSNINLMSIISKKQ